jgi:LytS/YehU family sensor histidine kinase
LQPHFLFNALHSLSDLVLEDSQAAVRMITKLGDFLRLTLESPGDQIVPLRQELAFARSYLDIQRVRFQDRLKIVIAAEPETYAAQVPNFVLQPIVENAIKHGLASRMGAGCIAIKAKRRLDQLEITVEDDGPGPESDGQSESEHVGLGNVRARLRQLYGTEQSLELTRLNHEKSGAIVSLKIPFTTSKLDGSGNEQN